MPNNFYFIFYYGRSVIIFKTSVALPFRKKLRNFFTTGR